MTDSNSSWPIPAQLIEQLSSLISQQKACLAGYLWAESQGDGASLAENITGLAVAPKRKISVISASATGNAAGIAKKLTERLQSEYIITRIAGCPNGCGRAMLAELGLVGKAPGRYNMYLGGNLAGTRVPKQHLENATTEETLKETDSQIERWSKERTDNEEFGDFVFRVGVVKEIKGSATDFWD